MIRTVIDSNVFLSALLFGGNPRRVIALAERNLIELYTSEILCSEVERVLAVKFQWSSRRIAAATKYLWSLAQIVVPTQAIDHCADSDDNRVLECAIEARAGWIVMGDRHLLSLRPYRGIAILRPQELLAERPWRYG